MLLIPIDRITLLLERASLVEIPALEDVVESDESDARAAPDGTSDDMAEDDMEGIADTPAYRELVESLKGLTPPEVYDLLALGLLGVSEDAEESWDSAVEQAQAIAAEDALDELARILILTDAVESGLGRLGYVLGEDDDAEDVADEEESEDEAEPEA